MRQSVCDEIWYNEALGKVYNLMQTHPTINSPDGRHLDELVTLVEQYEAQHYPMTEGSKSSKQQ